MQIQDGEVSLVEPAEALREPYLAFYEEWKASGEPFVPWVTEMDPADFGVMIQTLHGYARGTDIPAGWVSSSTFWLVTADKRVVGAVNIRHRLTERLLHSGGHIGYGIVPSARRQGYASELLKQALLKSAELGIEQALVVCDSVNTASERTIRRNGGIEDSEYIEEDGNVIRRFWIGTGNK
ncbi:acetyltransferase, GNAT family protein [Paenibacillus sp. FSL R7-277]|uniref:GNAT family N-acetyltransferase n=1 Tax=Paenibacillus sp. FSL R7-277 TaxID=1227352 RepID=UPI0003E1E1BB|nr:GNAT family N-acetyltransferase [Paenibacillus sp. FSL R7-277]ETT72005.1 acetyltransferase, GNAT family protein [Paenibacillus sp. FSL R7-277]